ncbi:MAG: TRAP transporter substrate-binding protein DctP [Ignavibacteriales bacterium]|nr:TRAP transporter substrate-binding protein DctP [Ignavibacteriales bacterium]
MNRLLSLLVLSSLVLSALYSQQYTVRFATVAPEGSTWMNVMKEFDAAVRKESGGKLGFRIYAGATQGDEKVVLRKIRAGQIHSGGFTGVAMGEIAPMVRILDSPFLLRNYAEVDFLYQQFDKEFQKAFEEGGYVLLGWAEVGFVHVFTNAPIRKPDDLKGIKMWTWEGDPIAETSFKALGINPIPLSLDNVLTSLQTGLIDAFYTSPYAATVLQWYTRVKYMVDAPLADAAGAVLISKKYFDTIPTDLQEILVRNGRTYLSKLTRLSREDNKKSVEEMKKRGITVLPVQEKDVQQYIDVGARARRMLVGKLYSEEFLNRVETQLANFRKNNKGAQ